MSFTIFKSRSLTPLFLLSGFGSLIYQLVWQRVLTQEIGVDSISVTLIVTIFMLGLGLGGLAGERLVHRGAGELKMLSLLLACIGLFGIVSVPVIHFVNAMLPDAVAEHLWASILVNFLVLLLPTILMGATAPLMVNLVKLESSGRATARAYTMNVLGAASGAIVAGFVLVGGIGLLLSSQLAGLVDMLLAGLFLQMWRRASPPPAHPTIVQSLRGIFTSSGWLDASPFLLAASFVTGFAALGFEIAYFRIFSAYFGLSAYVFPILIFAYLVNMAIGTFLGGRLSARHNEAFLFVIFLLLAALAAIPVQYVYQWMLDARVTDLAQVALLADPNQTDPFLRWAPLLASLPVAVVLMAPVTFISALFPLFVNVAGRAFPGAPGAAFGKIYFYQTIGNALGSMVTGLVIYRFANTIQIFAGLVAMLVLAAILFFAKFGARWQLALAGLMMGIALLSTAAFNFNFYDSIRFLRTHADLVKPDLVYDDIFGMTLVYPQKTFEKTSFTARAGGRFHITSIPAAAAMHYPARIAAGTTALAYVFNPEVKDILFIGLGTSTELIDLRQLFPSAHIDVVEINGAVLEATRTLAYPPVLDALNHSTAHVMDGRRFVLHQEHRQYDYIHIGVDRASTPGAGNLFSTEFLAILRDRLNPRGLITFYGYPPVIRSALSVFPETVLFSVYGGISELTIFKEKAAFDQVWGKTFEARYAAAFDRLNANPYGIAYVLQFQASDSFVVRSSVLRRNLGGVRAATDNLLATEYYLNNRQSAQEGLFLNGHPRDLRIWEIPEGAEPFPGPQTGTQQSGESRTLFTWRERPGMHPGLLAGEAGPLSSSRRFEPSVSRPFLQARLHPEASKWSVCPMVGLSDERRVISLSAAADFHGRGRWGIALRYRGAKGEMVEEERSTIDQGRQQLRLSRIVPPDATGVQCIVEVQDAIGIGSGTARLRLRQLTLSSRNSLVP